MTKILVVEDDQNVAAALRLRLESQGYDVDLAVDGTAAMSCAVHGSPDLVLLDVSLPAGSGLSVAERLQSIPETASIPRIFLTASRRPEDEQKAGELGAVAFLQKPWEPGELLEAIERGLAAAKCEPA